jgi:hypothetical protein
MLKGRFQGIDDEVCGRTKCPPRHRKSWNNDALLYDYAVL